MSSKLLVSKIRPPPNKPQFVGEDSWNILENAFKQIYQRNASSLSFEELYR
jgi:hypothetical protein